MNAAKIKLLSTLQLCYSPDMMSTVQTRPKSVGYAVWLLCAAGLVDWLACLWRGGVLVGPCLGLVAIVALSFATLRGYAWGRGIFLVWCALKFSIALTLGLFSLVEGRGLNWFEIASTALLIVACDLLFRRPSCLWFDEMGAERYRRRLRA